MINFRKEPLPESSLNKLITRCGNVSKRLEEFEELLPNDVQNAIAAVATLFSMSGREAAKIRRQLWSVPAGCGKTRCIAATLYHVLEMDEGRNITDVYVMFANENMLERERGEYTRLGVGLGSRVAIKLVSAENYSADISVIGKNCLLLIDEVNVAILDRQLFKEAPAQKHDGLIIGFTATMFRKQGGVEHDYLK